MPAAGITLRQAGPADSGEIARLNRATRQAALPYLPVLRTPAEDLVFFRERVFAACEVWVAARDRIVGFCAFRPGWVDHLYVDPAHHGRGLGSALLAKAMAAHGELKLWVFQRNTKAIRFYEARAFARVATTDGGGNEEREPDALYAWSRQSRFGSAT